MQLAVCVTHKIDVFCKAETADRSANDGHISHSLLTGYEAGRTSGYISPSMFVEAKSSHLSAGMDLGLAGGINHGCLVDAIKFPAPTRTWEILEANQSFETKVLVHAPTGPSP